MTLIGHPLERKQQVAEADVEAEAEKEYEEQFEDEDEEEDKKSIGRQSTQG